MAINGDIKKTLRKFGLISSIIFSIIIALSIVWIHVTDFSNLVFVQVINIIILSSGIIGLGYCILILRTFDHKIDKDIAKNYKDIIEDLEGDNKDNNKVICF